MSAPQRLSLAAASSRKSLLSRRFRPALEALEDRTLPSIVPISIADPRVQGASANNHSGSATISADGTRVVFTSLANNLTPLGTTYSVGAVRQIYVQNLITGTTDLVSVGMNGAPANSSCGAPLISPDGRFVAFTTYDTELVNLPRNNQPHLFVRDLQSGTTQLVDITLSGLAPGDSFNSAFAIAFSANGRYLAFESQSSNLVLGDTNADSDIFVRDLVAQTTVKVTQHGFTGSSSSTVSGQLQFSSDNRWLVFATSKSQVAADTNGVNDVYRWDVQTQTLELVSVNNGGTAAANNASDSGSVSGDGRYIAFRSQATNLLAAPTSGANIFVRDTVAGTTTLVSATPGGQAVNNCTDPWISADGRYVLFEYSADFIGNPAISTPGPGNGARQVYRRDLQLGATTLITLNTAGTGGGNGASDLVAVTADARYVLVRTVATNLTTLPDTNGVADGILFDLQSGERRVISRNLGGTATGNAPSVATSVSNVDNFFLTTTVGGGGLSMSATGPTVVFHSLASNLAAEDNNLSQDVFVYRWNADAVDLVSRRSPLLPAAFMAAGNNFFNQAGATAHGTSADGRYVLFTSISSELTPSFIGSANYEQVYLRDTVTGVTQLVSINAAGTGIGVQRAFAPRMTPDGRYVIFLGRGDHVAGSADNGSEQVFIRDLQTQTTRLVSVSASGTARANGSVQEAVVSADGRYVAFTTTANNLVAGISVSGTNVYVRDLVANTTTLASINTAGTASGTGSFFNTVQELAISSDGQWLSFVSDKSDLTATPDGNNGYDVFIRDLFAGVTHLVTVNLGGNAASGGNQASMSADGRYIAFRSQATDLVATPTNGQFQAYVRDRQTGTTALASINAAGTAGSAIGVDYPRLSANGRYLVFLSYASDLVAAPPTTGVHLFWRDLQTGQTRMVDVNAAGTAGSDGYFYATNQTAVSDDGNTVVFIKQSSNLLAGIPGLGDRQHVYSRNMATGVTTLLTAGGVSAGTFDLTSNLSLTPNGQWAVFTTTFAGLYAGDTNGVIDVYLTRTTPSGGLVSGTVFLDLNQNGVRDPGELGLAGIVVYLDLDGNGVRGGAEPFVLTAGDGSYAFGGLAAGTYLVRQELPAGHTQTLPAGGAPRSVTLTSDDDVVLDVDFGTFRLLADLIVSNVTAPASVVPGQTFTVSWTIHNVGGSTATGPWEDAVYLSADGILDPDDIFLGSLNQSAPLLAGGSRQASLTVTAPIVAGQFRVIVQTNRRRQVSEESTANNLAVAANQVAVNLPQLQIGVPLVSQFTAPGQTRYFQLNLANGDAGVLTAAARAGGQVRLEWFGTDQRSEGGSLAAALVSGSHILAVTDLGPAGASAQFTLLATQPGPTLRSATPGTIGNAGQATLRISGLDLRPGTQFQLVGPGGVVVSALDSRLLSSVAAEATFNLVGRPAGSYTLRAILPGGPTITLATPLSLTNATPVPLAQAVRVQLSLPAEARFLTTSVFYVRVTNTSANDVPAPLLMIRSPSGSILSTAPFVSTIMEPDGTAPFLQVVAAGNSGTPGVLRPGEEVVIPIYFRVLRNPVDFVELQAFTLHGDDARPFDPALIDEAARPVDMPDPAWAPIRDHLVSRIGTTQGDYVRFLASAASLMPAAMGSVRSPVDLLQFESRRSQAILGQSVQGRIVTTDPQLNFPGRELRLIHRVTGAVSVTYVLRDGTFNFTELADGTYDLRAPGMVLPQPPEITVQQGQPVTGLEVDASRTVRVSGYVAGLDGAPALGAVVQLLGPNGSYRVNVDYTGHYALDTVAPGTYELRVSAPGRVRHVASEWVVGLNGRTENIALAPEARLLGSVTFVGGPPASGSLSVDLIRRDGSHLTVGIPLISGLNFSYDRLPPGSYDLTIRYPGYRTQTLTNVQIEPGQFLTLPPIALSLNSTISGTVTTTLPGGSAANLVVGVFDGGGTLLGAVSTNGSGQFALTDIAPGTYQLRVINLREGVSTRATVTIAAGDHVNSLALQVTQGARIRGVVQQVGTGDPIIGIAVMAINSAGEIATARTDETGAYEFQQVAGDTYRVSLLAAGTSGGGSQTVSVAGADGEIAVVNLTRDAGVARIGGQVRTAGGQGIANAGVFLFQNGTPILAGYTDADGHYDLTLDLTGTFDLFAVGEGASFTPISGMVVANGANLTFDFVAGAAPLTLTVSAPGGSGGIDVEVYQVIGGAQLLVARRSLGLSGGFTLGNLTPGTYRLRADSGNNQGLDEIVTVGTGGLTLTRTLAGMARLTGVVRDDLGNPLGNARVIVTSASGGTWVAQTNSQGEYALQTLPAGSYTIDVLAEGQTALHDTVVLSNGAVQRDFSLVSNEGTLLTGRLLDALGRPIVGVNVLVTRPDGSVAGYVRTGTLGGFTISTAQGSNLTLEAVGMGYVPINLTGINLSAGDVVNLGDLSLVLAGLGSNPFVPAPSPLFGGPTPQFPFGFGGQNFPGVTVQAPTTQPFLAPIHPAAVWIARINEDLAFGGFVGDPTWNELNNLIASMDPKCRARCQPLIDRAMVHLRLLEEMRQELSDAKADVINGLGNFTTAAGRDFLVAAGTLAGIASFVLELGAMGAIGGELTFGSFALTGKGAAFAAAEATTVFFNDLLNIYSQMQSAANASDPQGLEVLVKGLPSALLSAVNLFAGPAKAVFGVAGGSGVKAIDLGLHGLDWVNFFGALVSGITQNFQFQATRDTAEALDIYHKRLQNVIKTYTAQSIRARNAMNDLRLCHANCDDDETPEPPPVSVDGRLRPVGSRDPNEKLGAGGHAEPRFVTPGSLLPYTIFFENTPTQATAPAQEVFIDDYLDADADWSTFEFGDVGFGNVVVHVPAGLQYYKTRVTYQNTDGSPLFVDVEMSFNRVTGHIRWVFRSVDPETGALPEGAQDGFLPVNDESGRGEGFVRYSVRAKANLATGTRVDNSASIVFDANDALVTNTVTNTIDRDAPLSSVAALAPIQSGPTFTVSWAGNDGAGSGIAAFDVYVSVDGGAFVLWQAGTTATSASFTGERGRTYRFYSVAVDNVGWRQATPAGAQATTRIAVVSNGPRVTNIVIADNTAQRSRIWRVQVNFDRIVQILPGAFELVRLGYGNIPTFFTTFVYNGVTVALLYFRGPMIEAGSLPDGQYRLITRGDRIRSLQGQWLDGDEDGVQGGNRTDAFFRLYGDANGDGRVDDVDRQLFLAAYNSRVGWGNYRWYFDANGDGRIDHRDAGLFMARFGRSV